MPDSQLGSPPFVSVVIPVLDEERHIGECLCSVLEQDYPPERMEVLVVDGGSADSTLRLIQEVAGYDARVRLIHNPRRTQAAALNIGIEAARGEVVARLDGHAAWSPSHLRRCVEVMEETGAVNVGGTMEVVANNALAGAIAAATSSPLGVGGAWYRYAREQREVDTVFLGCFRRSALREVGGFDETLPVHEDYELNQRLRAAGGRIVFCPDLPTRYWPRSTWASFAHQYFRYGEAKARVSLRDSRVLRPYHLAPPALALVLAASLVGASSPRTRRAAFLVLGIYAAGCVAAAGTTPQSRTISGRALTAAIIATMHVGWGIGFWRGLLRGALN